MSDRRVPRVTWGDPRDGYDADADALGSYNVAIATIGDDVKGGRRPVPDFMRGHGNLPATGRKRLPITTGLLDYFPAACAAVAECSLIATAQHHPDKPMHWERDKSTDHADCLVRHLIDRGKTDIDGVRHSAKVAWRALALLQLELEAAGPGSGAQ